MWLGGPQSLKFFLSGRLNKIAQLAHDW